MGASPDLAKSPAPVPLAQPIEKVADTQTTFPRGTMAKDFTPTEKVLYDGLVARFGTLKAARHEGEDTKLYFERMSNAGLFRAIEKASLRDVRNYNALKTAEAAGTVVHVTKPEPPEALTFDREELRTLDNYRIAKAAATRAGKELAYE